jgi:uncharacterized membrane protein
MSTERPGHLSPLQLSETWRRANEPDLRARRWIAGLSLLSGAVMSGIGLFQLGIIRRIPDPPGPFDAARINGSPQAYSILRTPDALLGALSYAATACLAGAGDPDRSRTAPWLSVAMGAKLLADASIAGKLTVTQWTRYRAFCFWCLLTTGATVAAAVVGIPETLAAARTIAERAE